MRILDWVVLLRMAPLALLVLAMFISPHGARAGPQRIIAVNAGGPSFVSTDDTVYEADRYHNGGEASEYGIRFPIANTNDPELYQTERFALTGQDLLYTLPMPLDIEGTFVLTLKFSEVYFSEPGQKVFAIVLNGHRIVEELDIFRKVGKNAAYDIHREFQLEKDNTLTIDGRNVEYDGELQVPPQVRRENKPSNHVY
eukprot:SAG11_NODE_2499_length_3286_cov_6.125824_2_plen_198_part_00